MSDNTQIADVLHKILYGTISTTGHDFLKSLTKVLTENLKVKFAFISQVIEDNKLITVTFCKDNKFLPNFIYSASGTPCEKVIENGEACYQEHVQKSFPTDKFLVNENIESYYAIAFGKKVKGHMGIMDVKPLVKSELIEAVLKTIVDRAGAELERAAFEKSLNESIIRNKAIMETANDGIITINEKGVIKTLNPASEKIFGYKGNELLGKNITILIPEPLKSRLKASFKRYLKTGEKRVIGTTQEMAGLKKNGELVPIELSISEVVLDGQRSFTGIIRDISKRKQLEQEILKVRESERKKIGKDLHDGPLQTLAGLKIMLHTLKKEPEVLNNKFLDGEFKLIEQSFTTSIDQIIRVVEKLVPIEVIDGDIAESLTNFIAQTQEFYKIPCSLEYDQSINIKNDDIINHLFNITKEAITNAAKHSKAKQIKVIFSHDKKHVIVKITDDGKGIAKNISHHAGRGLYIMHERARQINAELTIKGSKGKGTEVVCSVPHS